MKDFQSENDASSPLRMRNDLTCRALRLMDMDMEREHHHLFTLIGGEWDIEKSIQWSEAEQLQQATNDEAIHTIPF